MKNIYLPKANNDSVFTFIGNPDVMVLIACGVIFVVLITLIILMIRKKRKGGK